MLMSILIHIQTWIFFPNIQMFAFKYKPLKSRKSANFLRNRIWVEISNLWCFWWNMYVEEMVFLFNVGNQLMWKDWFTCASTMCEYLWPDFLWRGPRRQPNRPHKLSKHEFAFVVFVFYTDLFWNLFFSSSRFLDTDRDVNWRVLAETTWHLNGFMADWLLLYNLVPHY